MVCRFASMPTTVRRGEAPERMDSLSELAIWDAEVLAGRHYAGYAQVQQAFDTWRNTYNSLRPHEALQLDSPIDRYRPSDLRYPHRLAPIEYPEHDHVVTVGWNEQVQFQGHKLCVSSAVHQLPEAFSACPHDVYFCHQKFKQIDLRAL